MTLFWLGILDSGERTITQAMLWTKSNNFRVTSAILLEFELVRDFIPVQVICNFHKDPVKTKPDMLRTRSIWDFPTLKGKQLHSQQSELARI